MARKFMLPDLGSGLKEAEVLNWHVKEGEEVTTEQLLCDVETEKAVIDVPVPYDGVVLSLAVAEGEMVAVGGLLAVISKIGEAPEDTTEEKTLPEEYTAVAAETLPETSQDKTPSVADPVKPVGDRLRAMPGTRKLARQRGVDLGSVSGSGKAGRITRNDIERHDGVETGVPVDRGTTKVEKLSMLRQSIARNMAKAWQEIPHCFTSLEVDATWFLESRRVLGEVYGKKLPMEALLIKAVIPALIEFPHFNATFKDGEMHFHHHYDIGMAVDTPGGLIVPVVRNADQPSVDELGGMITDLVQRTVDRRADPSELSGQTFTINNIGAAGNVMGTSIIPQGTTAILSAGRAQQKPVVRDGKIVIAPIMELALAFDHRALDGGHVQRFMKMVGENIEQPVRYLTKE